MKAAMLIGALGLPWGGAAAQAPQPAPAEVLRVFLDCYASCDGDFFRREIAYVNWMRDRQDADVHLLITDQNTGGGGEEVTLKFIGLRAFAGVDDELRFHTEQSATFNEVRAQLAQRIGLGLARYVARGPLASRVRLDYRAPPGGAEGPVQQPRDPWNFWLFTLGAEGNLEGESQNSSNELGGSIEARRVTERWKLSTEFNLNRRKHRFDLDSGQVFRSTTSRYTYELLLARSIGPRWTTGFNLAAGRSSVSNYDLLVRFAPGLEFNLFPYAESSRRQVVFVYEVGLAHADYQEETVFSRLEETRVNHSLTIAAEGVAPWGEVEASLSGSTYLDRWNQNRLTAQAGIEVRLARGLELELFGTYSRVRDQISLAKEGASDEEILLRLKQLQTDYRYELSIGLSYTFGSRYNNVVNPRYGNSVDTFSFYYF